MHREQYERKSEKKKSISYACASSEWVYNQPAFAATTRETPREQKKPTSNEEKIEATTHTHTKNRIMVVSLQSLYSDALLSLVCHFIEYPLSC